MTSPGGRPRGRRSSATHLAGWVFADLTVVVLLIVLVMTPARPIAKPPEPPTSSPPQSPPTPTPTLVEPSQPPVLELDEVPKIRIQISNADLVAGGARGQTAAADLEAKLKKELSTRRLTERQAGLLLTFGGAPSSGFQGNLGRRAAERANQVILRKLPRFSTAKTRAYWTFGVSPDFVEIEMFFFAE